MADSYSLDVARYTENGRVYHTVTVEGWAWWLTTLEGFQTARDMETWCIEQFGEPHENNWLNDHSRAVFKFTTAEQAMLFKLAWG